MLGELTVEAADAADDGDLPALKPLLVAPADDVETIVRARRGEVAMLTLRLRSKTHDLGVAEVEGPPVDVDGARDLLRVSLNRHIEARRREFDAAVEAARLAAAEIVTAAHREATALLDAANAEVVQTLLQGVDPDRTPPNLRVVEDAVTERAMAGGEPAVVEPGVSVTDVVVDRAPTVEPPAAPEGESEADRAVALIEAVRGDVAPRPAPVEAPPDASAPTAPASPEATRVGPAVAAAASPVQVIVPPWMQSPEAWASFMSAFAPPGAAATGHMVATPVAVSAAAPAPARPGRWSVKHLLYIDVLLPAIAVLIVVAVILAWIG